MSLFFLFGNLVYHIPFNSLLSYLPHPPQTPLHPQPANPTSSKIRMPNFEYSDHSTSPRLGRNTLKSQTLPPDKNIRANKTLRPKQPFNLTFCSGAYFKIRTLDIDVVAYPCGRIAEGEVECGKFSGGEEVVHHVLPTDSYGYELNLTLWPISGSQRPGQWAIGVLDHTTGYYTAGQISEYFVPVTFKAAEV
ncbi:hypothetical protein K402DRAFT_408974 [Aulographum hederae CBS 113979]|uniref:Uncharacterized protein n=1 Tax=Aulographum hederae CBS 113979 TaxID=1176131 RepID=A0A6G1GJ39_9PEZI|nr:hypothetical protein K402DRAFT_408974 [Aulographum hederae CBS 113979]